MVQLLVLIDRFGCKLHAQLLKDLDIHVRQHDRGVYLAAPQFGELGQGLFGRTVRGRAHGQGNQYLVRVKAWVLAAHVLGLKGLDGLNRGWGNQVYIVGNTAQYLDGVQQQGGGSA